MLSQSGDYLEAQTKGLVYENSTLTTYATEDIPLSFRELNAEEEQLHISGNTIESLIPAILKLYASEVSIEDTTG